MSRIAIIIPTRLKSSRLPNKPLAMVNGKTVIQRVYEHAVKEHPAKDIYIAAGDKEIINEVSKFGAQSVLTDPSLPSGTDRIVSALKEIDPKGTKYDTVVNYQGDGINVDPKLNLQLVDLLEKTGSDWATVCKEITDLKDIQNPTYVKIAVGIPFGQNYGRALYFSRSPIPFNRDKGLVEKAYWHIGIYVYKIDALKRFVACPIGILEKQEKLEQLRALENGMTISTLVVSSVKLIEDAPADINTPEDLAQAQDYFKD